MGKKGILARMLCWGGLCDRIRAIRSKYSKMLHILAYHRVFDLADEGTYAFDADLISSSEQEFEWQMDFVRQRYEVTNFAAFEKVSGAGSSTGKPPLIVTFDDGYRDNFHIAQTVLSKKRMTAVFFVSTGFVDDRKLFWFERVYHYFITASDAGIEIAGRPYAVAGPRASRVSQACLAIRHLKEVSNDMRLRALELVDQRLSDLLNDKASAPHRAMTWDQLRGLASMGMEIGSHTVTHPVLSKLTDEGVRWEVAESRRRLQEETDEPVISISYPVGGEQDYDERTVRESMGAGYRFGCSYVSGSNCLEKLDAFRLKRLHVERYTSRARFIAMLAWPELFS